MTEEQEGHPDRQRLVGVTLDSSSIGGNNVDVDHEREIAIFDLLEANSFALEESEKDGPYTLHLSLVDNRLVLTVGDQGPRAHHQRDSLSLSPFRRIVKDYFMMCESYYQAIKTQPPSRIEAIDVGRRGLHDEGSRLLMERLKGKIAVDIATARRPLHAALRAALEGLSGARRHGTALLLARFRELDVGALRQAILVTVSARE